MLLRAFLPCLVLATLASCAVQPVDEESLVARAVDHAALGFIQQSIRKPSEHAADAVEVWAAPEAASAYGALVPGDAADSFPSES